MVHTFQRKIALVALVTMMLCLAPAALADSDFQAVVAVDSMNVYSQDAPHDYLGALPRGTVVTVKAYSGGAALISYGGRTGVAQVSDMSAYAQSAVLPQGVQESEQEAEGKAVVTTRKTRIYKKASTSSSYTTVKAGTSLTLLAVNGECAKVSYKGKVRYAVYSHLGQPGSAAVSETPVAESVTETVPEQAASVQTGNAPVVTTQSVRIYSGAYNTGDYTTVDKGTGLTLLAVRGDCAMVERNGAIGYTAVSALESAPTQASTPRPSANPFSSGSNEHAIYAFLTEAMSYNRAAAMGVLANIKYESSYNPDCNGDGGTSYGICQWHAGRKTNLISWCEENGLDYTTLDGQLQFFRYEVKNRYPSVHSYLKQVENSADGAYDAGYYFCFNYEAPAARTSQSTKRAEYARDTLFAK